MGNGKTDPTPEAVTRQTLKLLSEKLLLMSDSIPQECLLAEGFIQASLLCNVWADMPGQIDRILKELSLEEEN